MQKTRSWPGRDVVTDFALVAALAALTGMSILMWWVSGRIEQGVVQHATASIALHLDSFVEPHLQDLETGDRLSDKAIASLQGLLLASDSDNAMSEITIWDRNGRLVYSTDSQKHGGAANLETPAEVYRALSGSVESGIVDGARSAAPQLTIFAPMHTMSELTTIGVAEVHQGAGGLARALRSVRIETGGLMLLLSLAMAGSMFGIVRKSGQTITQQRGILADRVRELSGLLHENTELQRRILEANRRSTAINDRILKRISAELHDGPVQLIALALLRLEGVRADAQPDAVTSADADIDAIESALRDALKEIRGLSSGLALPALEGASVRQAIEYAVMNHEARSRTRVQLELEDELPEAASSVFLTSLYRFVQEGLNNAVRHAKGKDQEVRAFLADGDLVIEVRDGGPGLELNAAIPLADANKGLGLAGLRDRIETLGGKLTFGKNGESGTCLRARFGKEAQETTRS